MSKYRIIMRAGGLLIFAAYLQILMVSCDDDPQVIIIDEDPYIHEVVPTETYIGGKININGANFGMPTDSSVVFFDSTLQLSSFDCIKWNDAVIELEIPQGATSGTFTVNVGYRQSNKAHLEIDLLPPFDMQQIPAGTSLMGSELGQSDERPVHDVTLTKNFQISKYEVSRELWKAVTGYDPGTWDGSGMPVNNISWEDAIEFCNQLSKMKGYDTCYIETEDGFSYDTTADGYRLPTEAEWEYACRAGSLLDIAGTGKIDEMAWYADNSGFAVHPSGRKLPNDYFVYDMHGNLWEWCWDFYDADYYSISPAVNPLGPVTGAKGHVARGGAYNSGAVYVRSSNRTMKDFDIKYCGIRIVRTIF